MRKDTPLPSFFILLLTTFSADYALPVCRASLAWYCFRIFTCAFRAKFIAWVQRYSCGWYFPRLMIAFTRLPSSSFIDAIFWVTIFHARFIVTFKARACLLRRHSLPKASSCAWYWLFIFTLCHAARRILRACAPRRQTMFFAMPISSRHAAPLFSCFPRACRCLLISWRDIVFSFIFVVER